jgi:hypothetical protein
LEIGLIQAHAIRKGVLAEVGDAAANDDIREAVTKHECLIADVGDAVGNGQIRQGVTLIERLWPMLLTPLPKITFVRLLHTANANGPMPVTLPGIITFLRPQLSNAPFSMLVMLLGIVTPIKGGWN